MSGDRASVAWDVRRHEELDSTNVLALQLARQGAPEGLVVVAHHQTSGRGRLGRTWEAPPGSSLLVSILFRPGPTLPPERAHLLTAAVGTAAAAACESLTGVRPGLKWPNDLLVGGRKLAGILAESDLSGGQLAAVVVGLGLNVSSAPPGLVAISLAEAVRAAGSAEAVPALDVLLDAVLHEIDQRYPRFDQVAAEFRQRCETLGREVKVELGHETLVGTAVDLSDEGHLGVRDSEGRLRWIAAGDVTHLRPA
jgi:BirA family biotin operon repressor/biotin-[acetyl-CoA-carboxylase] ligase